MTTDTARRIKATTAAPAARDTQTDPRLKKSFRRPDQNGETVEHPVITIRGHWDSYYRNIAEHLSGNEPLAVTADEGREVARLLEAAVQSSREHRVIEGPWGNG